MISTDSLPEMWPHQKMANDQIIATLDDPGVAQEWGSRTCVTSPTGGGKTLMATYQIIHAINNGLRVTWHTNRRMLCKQVFGVFRKMGLEVGLIASNAKDFIIMLPVLV